jgi:CheY-like chemotaxis protein
VPGEVIAHAWRNGSGCRIPRLGGRLHDTIVVGRWAKDAADGAVLELGPGETNVDTADSHIKTSPFQAMKPFAAWDIPLTAGKSPARVLIVDDEPLIRWSLAELLTECGCQVAEAGDAQTALGLLVDGFVNPDVVVLDLRLPDTDDLSLVEALRRSIPRARLILMTAFGSPEVVQQALDLGVFRVVSKPFEMHEMVGLVQTAHRSGSR